MYYLQHVYPLIDPQYPDAEHIDISTEGFGRPDDEGVREWGPFETIEDARAKLDSQFPERREEDPDALRDAQEIDPALLERYRPGSLRAMGNDETSDWVYESLRQEVTTATTDEEVDALAKELDESAEAEGVILYGDTAERIRDYRDGLED